MPETTANPISKPKKPARKRSDYERIMRAAEEEANVKWFLYNRTNRCVPEYSMTSNGRTPKKSASS